MKLLGLFLIAPAVILGVLLAPLLSLIPVPIRRGHRPATGIH